MSGDLPFWTAWQLENPNFRRPDWTKDFHEEGHGSGEQLIAFVLRHAHEGTAIG
jgi:hypothetical protein